MLRLLAFAILLGLSTSTIGQGIVFFDGDWKDALALAKKEEKALFIDAYTTWCGPCKRMAKNVFTQEDVGAYYNDNFINLKVNMESDMGYDFGAKYPVSGYPTLLFLDGDGKIVHKSMGGKNQADFLKMGAMVMRKNDQSGKFAEKYEAGERDFELVYKYIKALNTAGKSSLKITNEYLRSKPELTDGELSKLLLAGATDADSRVFDQLLDNKKIILSHSSKEELDAAVKKACMNTLNKAVEFDSEDLYKEAKKSYKKYDKKGSKKFNIEADMHYFKGMRQIEDYLNTLSKYCEKFIKDDAAELNKQVKGIISTRFRQNEQALDIAEAAIIRATEVDEKSEYWLNYAQVLVIRKEKPKAIEATNKAIEIAKANNQPTKKLIMYKNMLEGNR